MFLSVAWIACGCLVTISIGQVSNQRSRSSPATTTEDPFAAIFGFVSFPDTHDPFADALNLDSKVESWANRLLTGDVNINEIHNAAIQTTTTSSPPVQQPVQRPVQLPVQPQPKGTRNNLTPVETRGPETSVNELPLGLQFLNSRRNTPPRPQPTKIVPIPRDRGQRNSNENNRLFNSLPPLPNINQLTGPGGIFENLFPSLPGDPSNNNSVAIPGDFFGPNFNQRNAPLPTIEMLGLSPDSFGLGLPGSGFQAGGEAGFLDTAPSSSLPSQNAALDTSLEGIPSRPSVSNVPTVSDPASNSILNILSGSSQNNMASGGNTLSEQSSGGLSGALGGQQMTGSIDQGGLNSLATGPDISGSRSLADIFGGANSGEGSVPSPGSLADNVNTQSSSSNTISSLNDLLGGQTTSTGNNQGGGLGSIVDASTASKTSNEIPTIPSVDATVTSNSNRNTERRITVPSESDRQVWNSLIPPLPANRNPVETFGSIGDPFPSIPTIDQLSGTGLRGTESSLPPSQPRSNLPGPNSQPSPTTLDGVFQPGIPASAIGSAVSNTGSQSNLAINTNVQDLTPQSTQTGQSSTQNVESLWQNLVNEIPALNQLTGSKEIPNPNEPFKPIPTVGQTNTEASIPQIPTIEQLFPGFPSIDQLTGGTSNATNNAFPAVSGDKTSASEVNSNIPFLSLDQLTGGSSNVDQGTAGQEFPQIPSLNQLTGGTSANQDPTTATTGQESTAFPSVSSIGQFTESGTTGQESTIQAFPAIPSLGQLTDSATTGQESTIQAFPAIPSLGQLTESATTGQENTNQAFPAIPSLDQITGSATNGQESSIQSLPSISSLDQLSGSESTAQESTSQAFPAITSLDQLLGGTGAEPDTANQAFPSISSLDQLTASTETNQETSPAFPSISSLSQLAEETGSSQGSTNQAFPAIPSVNQISGGSTSGQQISSDTFPGIPTIDQIASNIANIVAATSTSQAADETGFPAIPTIEEIANAVASNTPPNQQNPANPSTTGQTGQTLQVAVNQGTSQLQNRNVNQVVGTRRNTFLNVVSDPNPSGSQAPNLATNIGLPLNPFSLNALQRTSNNRNVARTNANGLLVVDIQSPQTRQTQNRVVPNQPQGLRAVGNSNSQTRTLPQNVANLPQIPNNLLGIPNNLLRNRQQLQLQRLRALQQNRQQQQGRLQNQQGQASNLFLQQQQQILQQQQTQRRRLQLQQQLRQQQIQQQQVQQQQLQQLRQRLIQLQRQRQQQQQQQQQQQTGLNRQLPIANTNQGVQVPGGSSNSQILLRNRNQLLNQNILNRNNQFQGVSRNNQQQSNSFVDPVINTLVNLNQFNQRAPAIAPTSAPLPRTQIQNRPVGILTRNQFLSQMNAFRLAQLARRIRSFTPPTAASNIAVPTNASPGILPIPRNGLFGPQGNLLNTQFASNRIRDAQREAIRLAINRQLSPAPGSLQNTVSQPGRRFDLLDRSQVGLQTQQQINPGNPVQGQGLFNLPFNDAINNLLRPNPTSGPNNFDLSMRMNDPRLLNGNQIPRINILNPTQPVPTVLPASQALERVQRARILMSGPNPFRPVVGLGIPGFGINQIGQGLPPILPGGNLPAFITNPEQFIIPLNGGPPVSFPGGIGNTIDSPFTFPGIEAPGSGSWLRRQIDFLGNGAFI